jgi:hypothetical protein
MRRSVLIIGVALASLSLAACGDIPGGPVAPGSPAVPPAQNQVDQIISQVQQAAVTACQFQPTISTVSSIIGTFTSVGAQIASVNDLAARICSAIAVPRSAKRGASKPTFCGPDKRCVAIHGKWVSQ